MIVAEDTVHFLRSREHSEEGLRYVRGGLGGEFPEKLRGRHCLKVVM
jgi:hypothetical protein